MTPEQTVAWLAGFISARYRNKQNPRPNQEQWDHIVGMLKDCSHSCAEDTKYQIGIAPLNCS